MLKKIRVYYGGWGPNTNQKLIKQWKHDIVIVTVWLKSPSSKLLLTHFYFNNVLLNSIFSVNDCLGTLLSCETRTFPVCNLISSLNSKHKGNLTRTRVWQNVQLVNRWHEYLFPNCNEFNHLVLKFDPSKSSQLTFW